MIIVELESLVSSKAPGDSFPSGDTKVTYTATDVCGNTSSSSFTVTVVCRENTIGTRLVGVVMDDSTKEPVAGAIVTALNSTTTISNEEGKFSMLVSFEARLLNISKVGYLDLDENVESLNFNEDERFYMIKQSTEVEISGTVVDEDGNSIRYVSISHYFAQGTATTNTTSDLNGNFKLTIPDGRTDGFIEFSKLKYSTKEINLEQVTIPLRIVLKEFSFEVNGKVLESKYEDPIITAKIVLKGTNIETNSDIDGNFRLFVPDKSGILQVSYPGFNTEEIFLEEVAVPLDIVLIESTLDVYGTVTDENGKEPLVGVKIFIEGTTTETTSDIDGNFRLNKPNKDGMLEFSHLGYISESIDLETATMPLTVRLKTDARFPGNYPGDRIPSLEGKVLDGKNPINGAELVLRVKGTTYGEETDENGNFNFKSIFSQSGTLEISYKGLKTKEIDIDSTYWDENGEQIKTLIIRM